jgi:hypothetical protein
MSIVHGFPLQFIDTQADINNYKPIDNNVPTQLCEIDFLDIDDQDLLSAFDDIEIQQYGVSSGNTNVVQTENNLIIYYGLLSKEPFSYSVVW